MTRTRARLVFLSSFLASCGGAAPEGEQPAVTNPPATEAPAAVTGDAPAAPPAAGALELRCTSDKATFELTGATMTLAADGTAHRAERRWNQVTGQFQLTAGAITYRGELAGVRDADFAFVQLYSTAKQQDMPEVELTGGAPDGKGFILAWLDGGTQTTDTGHKLPSRASASASCTGSLLGAPAPTE